MRCVTYLVGNVIVDVRRGTYIHMYNHVVVLSCDKLGNNLLWTQK